MRDKKEELRNWIKKIGLTEKYFSEQYYIETYEDINEKEINRFYQKFKGQMKRDTTSTEIIELYMNYLFDMEEFKALNYVKPNYIMDDNFSKEFNNKMKNISILINNKLES